jgi:LacI family transcriptional regulator
MRLASRWRSDRRRWQDGRKAGMGDSRRPDRPATLKDVAAVAGVSIATASKALRGGYKVHAATRGRVERAAEALRFTPSRPPSDLGHGRSGTVGLITNDLEGRFSIPIMMGAEDAFGTGGIQAFLCDARGDAAKEREQVRALLARRVDGFIFVGDTTNPRPSVGRDLRVPVVYAYSPSIDPADISVVSDCRGAGRHVVEHLVSNGRRRIAYIAGDPTFSAAVDRAAGATAAMADLGLTFVGGGPVFGNWSEAWGRMETRRLLASGEPIDAIACGADQLARGVLDALREAGVRVPADVAVMGHDDWRHIATQARPPLSSINMDLRELGRTAARLLFHAIDGVRETGAHTVPTRVVPRLSTGHPERVSPTADPDGA